MPKYTVEIHRTVTVKPESSGTGWIIFTAVLALILIVGLVANKPAPTPQRFQNPLGAVPASPEMNPFDQPPDIDIPDTAKPAKPAPPQPVVKQAAAGRVIAESGGFRNGQK